MIQLDRFYLIVDDAEWMRRLIPIGVKLVQLRVKDRSEGQIREQIAASMEICARHGARLIVNDHWRPAIDLGCDFVHLGQGDLDGADLPAIRRTGIRLGVSTHDHAELERALGTDPDYIALGPIYPTILKAMPWAPQGLERVSEWKRRIGRIPLVAIGGLTVDRLQEVFEAGADSAAVVSDVLRSPDPEARARQWIAAVKKSA